jgi:hypothetical protein
LAKGISKRDAKRDEDGKINKNNVIEWMNNEEQI